MRGWRGRRRRAETGGADVQVGGHARVDRLLSIAHADYVRVDSQPPHEALLQLQEDIADLVGRDALLDDLEAVIETPDACNEAAGARIALWGPPGVGKSAVATRLAHRVKDRFPNAQLHIDLGAGTGAPLSPGEALAELLHALGIDRPLPVRTEERSAWFRARMAERRALLVLDNARDMAQVRPLLPGSPTCCVIVTSRRPLGTFEGALMRRLDVLGRDAAVELLGEIAGKDRVQAEPAEAQKIAQLCGELPLALRIAGGRLAHKPERGLAWLATRLADAHRRLDELELDDKAVRASFSVSYEELSDDEARLFRRLAALPGRTFGTAVVAHAMKLPESQAERLLDALEDAQMLIAAGPERYGFHDLMRLLATELLQEEPVDTRRALTARAVDWLYEGAVHADEQLDRADDDHARAIAWFEAERESLVGAVEASHAAGRWTTAADLAFRLTSFLLSRGHWDDGTRTHSLAVDAARAAGDRGREAKALCRLGHIHSDATRWKEAADCFVHAIPLYRQAGNRRGVGGALGDLANLYAKQGRWDEAIDCFRQAFEIFDALDDARNAMDALNNLGTLLLEYGHIPDARTSFEGALYAADELGHPRARAIALDNLANAYGAEGRADEAMPLHEEALRAFRELGERQHTAVTLSNIGNRLSERGDRPGARKMYEAALEEYRDLGDRLGEAQALGNLANLAVRERRWEAGIAGYQQALSLFWAVGDRNGALLGLMNLGRAYGRHGDRRTALRYFEEALSLAGQIDNRSAEVTIVADIGGLHLRSGRFRQAARYIAAAGRMRVELDRIVEQRRSGTSPERLIGPNA